MMSYTTLTEHIAAKRIYGQAVCASMIKTLTKLGFPETLELPKPEFDNAVFSQETDPYVQSLYLVGYWYGEAKQRVGQIKFNCDGSFYAEFDVVQPHPSKKQWFVEAINAWGSEEDIRAEAKLLEIPQ
jgi:hypothetical protein